MNRFNHARMIEDTQPAYFKSIQPGMVLTFKYVAENISDKSPLILFLYYDIENGLIEGLNLNYISKYKLKMLFEQFKQTTKVGERPKEVSNLISDDYTYVSLPPLKKVTNPESKSERRVDMQRMYKKMIQPKFKKIYRSYSPNFIRTLKIVNLKGY